MAAINFPTATADGQTFEADNGVVYTYVGTPPNGYWSGTFQNEGYATLDGRYLKLDSSNDPVTASLEVNNNVTISRNSTAPGIVLNNSNYSGDDASIYYFDTGAVVFKSDDTEIFRYDADGNVGIGTNSPDVKLHVYSSDITQSWSDNAADLIKLEGSVEGINFVTSSTGFLSFSDADARAQGVIEYLHASDSMQFDTAGSEKMRIDSAGNVGIGSNTPSEKLVLANVAAPTGFSDTALSMIRSNYGGRIAGYLDQGVGHGITFDTIDSSTPTERVRITGEGNVGIGDSSPESSLSINKGGTLRLGAQENFMISGQPIGALYFGNTENPSGGIECDWQGVNNPTVAIGCTRDKSTGNLLKTQTRYQYDATIRNLINEQEVMRVQSGGLVLASGKGIVFDTSSTGLDDYEEGQFTPSLSDATAYTYRNGHYTKIGDMVYFYIRVQASASTPSGSPWQITGLPFQSTNLDCFGGAFRSYGRNVQQNTAGDAVDFHIPKNATNVIAKVGAGTANVATNNTNHVILNEQIILNGFYKTNS